MFGLFVEQCEKKPLETLGPQYFLLNVRNLGYIPFTCHGNTVYDHSLCACMPAIGKIIPLSILYYLYYYLFIFSLKHYLKWPCLYFINTAEVDKVSLMSLSKFVANLLHRAECSIV